MSMQDRNRPRLLKVLFLLGNQAGSLEVIYSDGRRERHPLFIGGSSAALVYASLATSSADYDNPISGGNRCLLINAACCVRCVGAGCVIGTLPSQSSSISVATQSAGELMGPCITFFRLHQQLRHVSRTCITQVRTMWPDAARRVKEMKRSSCSGSKTTPTVRCTVRLLTPSTMADLVRLLPCCVAMI